MSTVLEIETAISELQPEDFWKLAEWFDEVRSAAWDAQIEADAKAGRLDALWENAKLDWSSYDLRQVD